jgi:hypothetical protein
VTAGELLEDCRRRGIALEAVGEGLKVRARRECLTDALKGELSARKPELLALLTCQREPEPLPLTEAVAWRVAAMRAQHRPGEPFPVLLARPVAELPEVGCFTCGASLPPGYCRCAPCIEAAWIVVRESREA